jgi:hypothetical protein
MLNKMSKLVLIVSLFVALLYPFQSISSYVETTILIPEEVLKSGIPEDTALVELSVILGIPTSKLLEILKVNPETSLYTTIEELGITQEDIESARKEFRKIRWGYSWSIVLIGMIVIFLSLSLTGFLVGQIRHLAKNPREKKPKKKIIPRLANVKYRDTSYNSVIAAITALHLHLQEAEESSKMTIAWSREPVSVWKTSNKFNMPNRAIRGLKRS